MRGLTGLIYGRRTYEIMRYWDEDLPDWDAEDREAGIKGLVWHDLRATFGTRLGEAGYDAFTIAALMGQSQIQTTARYVRATERNKRAAVEAVMLYSDGGHRMDTTQKRPGALTAVNR